jgi:protein-S-isoprenylcysteine O-methyltransferase Ste14
LSNTPFGAFAKSAIMSTDYLIFLALYLFSLVIRTSYELLKKARKVNPRSTMVFAVILVVMCLMWATWFGMCPLDPLRLALPESIRWLGLGVLIVGLSLSIGALIQLRGVENVNHLVTTGLFSKVRHPMYTGFILWIFGWAIYHGAILSLIVGSVGIVNILYWQRLEEAELELRYGETYQNYRKETWF